MHPLFKYFSNEDFALAFMLRGQLFMQSLAAFRRYDDDNVRRDEQDGVLAHEPQDGLRLNFIEREEMHLPAGHRFFSSLHDEQVYVYCMSDECSEAMADRFESPFCVQINRPISLTGRLRRAIKRRSGFDPQIFAGPVSYRNIEEMPGVDWALPERLAFIKPPAWAWQREHRLVVGKRDCFAPENVRLGIGVNPPENRALVPEPLLLRIGDISASTRLIRF